MKVLKILIVLLVVISFSVPAIASDEIHAYTAFIKKENPYLSDKQVSKFVGVVGHYVEQYFSGIKDRIKGEEYIYGIIAQESAFKPDDGDNGNSKMYGQIQEPTCASARKYHNIKGDLNLNEMWDNLHCTVAHVRQLYDIYGGDWDNAITAYNMGIPTVNSLIRSKKIALYTDYLVDVKHKRNKIVYIKNKIVLKKRKANIKI